VPPRGKRKIAIQQMLPILTYGCKLYPTPSEQQRRLASEIYRWTVEAYRGVGRADKVHESGGFNDIGIMRANKGGRWAASVYGRYLSEFREIAEPILREVLEKDAE